MLVLVIIGAAVLYIAYVYRHKPRDKRPRPSTQQEASSATATFYTPWRNFSGHVKGISFPNKDGTSRQDIIRECMLGEEMLLIPENGNKYDRYAIRVCRKSGQQVGNWRGKDRRMHEELSCGKKFRVTVSDLYELKDSLVGMELMIEVVGEPLYGSDENKTPASA